MAQVNPRHVDAVMELINRSPYFELLGIRLTARGPMSAAVRELGAGALPPKFLA